jgi:hypothetical protein
VSFCEEHGIEIPDLNDCHLVLVIKSSLMTLYVLLLKNIYLLDFSDQVKINLAFHLRHFLFDARQTSNLKTLSIIQEL